MTFYLSSTGNDLNTGHTEAEPLRTVSGVLAKGFTSGCTLLLDADCEIYESLDFYGLEDVTITSYGLGQSLVIPGARSGITLKNCNNITISGLKLQGQGWKVCNKSVGIHVENCQNIRLINLETAGFHLAGILTEVSEHIEILGCYAHDNGSVGIATGGEPGENTRRSRHVKIAHCKVYDNAGDYTTTRNHSGNGIVISGTHHAIIEYCEAAGNGWGQRQTYVNGPVGMWACCGSGDVTFRWCIGRHNRTQPGAVDGDGFDIDGEVENSAIEYCYSYGNEGAGYLHCEFWGTHSVKNWHNNHNRYCLSVGDDIRIGDYGALAISSPYEVPMEKLYVTKNLFCAHNAAAIYNRDLKPQVKDIHITDNVLVTGGAEAIQNTTHHAMHVEGNEEIRDPKVQARLVEAAPLLTNPRILPTLPVYRMLEKGTCGEALRQGRYKELFGPHANKPSEKHQDNRLFELRLYDMDLEGCNYSGNVRLSYDSIRPGIITRMTGEGSQVHTPIPWWTDGRLLAVRVKARLTSPDVKACLFLRHDNGQPEQRVYLNGNVSSYHIAELSFMPNDKWEDPGKHIGVRKEGGQGDVLVHSIELYELNAIPPEPKVQNLDDFRQFGDVYAEGCEYVLNGPGAGLSKRLQTEPGRCTLHIEYKTDGTGMIALNGHSQTLSPVTTWTKATITADIKSDIMDIDIRQTTCEELYVRNINPMEYTHP